MMSPRVSNLYAGNAAEATNSGLLFTQRLLIQKMRLEDASFLFRKVIFTVPNNCL